MQDFEPQKIRVRTSQWIPTWQLHYNEIALTDERVPPGVKCPVLVEAAAKRLAGQTPSISEGNWSIGEATRVQSVSCGTCKTLLPPPRPLEIMGRANFVRLCSRCSQREAPSLFAVVRDVLKLPDPAPEPLPPPPAPKPEPSAEELRERRVNALGLLLVDAIECPEVRRPDAARAFVRKMMDASK